MLLPMLNPHCTQRCVLDEMSMYILRRAAVQELYTKQCVCSDCHAPLNLKDMCAGVCFWRGERIPVGNGSCVHGVGDEAE